MPASVEVMEAMEVMKAGVPEEPVLMGCLYHRRWMQVSRLATEHAIQSGASGFLTNEKWPPSGSDSSKP